MKKKEQASGASERCILVFGPYEWFAFLCQVEQWSCELGVILDEVAIEVTET